MPGRTTAGGRHGHQRSRQPRRRIQSAITGIRHPLAACLLTFLFVPHRRDAAAGPAELPASYQLLLEVVTAAGGPVRCAEVSVAAGLGEDKSTVEGVRTKLNRLVERGWLRAGKNGSFALMP
ncbi:hypothetical protein [Acrocarpospora sp. B8E8]|uniref:hypothetical protein n=1 Tax=Acrocarpospora sp. B8E8 TaxID=3153572 RepID=UPI00325EF249